MNFPIELTPGCTDDDACNYNPDADSNDGSCEYPEENFDCDGNCIEDIDCADVCGGDSTVDECGNCDNDVNNDCVPVTLSVTDVTSSSIEITMLNLFDVSGFQIDIYSDECNIELTDINHVIDNNHNNKIKFLDVKYYVDDFGYLNDDKLFQHYYYYYCYCFRLLMVDYFGMEYYYYCRLH